MAAPSSTKWGTTVTSGSDSTAQGRIGVYTSVSSTDTQTTVNVQVWFWTKYSCEDGYNNFYYDVGTNITSATTEIGDIRISHPTATGGGWSTNNQTKLIDKTHTYTRGTSAVTYTVYAKYNGIDLLPKLTMHVNTSFTVPALASYTISYNANGGSGAPSSQTKWYGKALTLSSNKPTRTGYSFQGWATSASGSVAYSAGGSYTANAAATLYAVWKANTYTVQYNANGGSGAPSAQTKTYGVNLTLSSTKPTRANYNFLGWGTSASSTTASYQAGGSYTNNAAITLYAIWQLAYTKPRITNYTVERCDSAGNASDEGTYARVKFNWACDKTLSSIVVKCISATAGSTSTNISASGTSGSVNKVIGGSLSTETTYTIQVTVTDANGSNSVSKTLDGMIFAIDFLAGGRGVAFGKPSELENYVDFGFDAHFDNYLGIYGRDLNGNIKLALQPQNENGNTVIGWGNYNAKSGNTNLYGHDVLIGVGNVAKPDTFRPYIRRGDSFNVKVHTSGYITDSSTSLRFFVSLSRPVFGSPTITATSLDGLQIRQNGQYLYGSSSSAYTTPASYKVESSWTYGVVIIAEFSNTTNVTNNDAVGVFWSGTLTFT